MIEMQPGAQPAEALEQVKELRRTLTNVSGTNIEPLGRLNAWREWSARAAQTTLGLLVPRDIERYVLGARHDLLHSIDPASYGNRLHALIDGELRTREAALDTLIGRLAADIAEWGHGQATAFLLDTNILMTYRERLVSVDWHTKANVFPEDNITLVIPIQVVEELDIIKDKTSGGDRNRITRQALNWLTSTFTQKNMRAHFPESVHWQHRNLDIALLVDDITRTPLPRTDADILDRALAVQPLFRTLTILSNDVSMRLRALTLGLVAEPLQGEEVPSHAPGDDERSG